ncbi:MFS transporter [Paractinoplanes durhamensis]|uniref:MFS transporter n=1 Tax=Paractinoplanes durhamensis TaxID=113563 RepID=UPI003635EBB0
MRRNVVLFIVISLVSGFGSTAMTLAAGIWVFDLTGSPAVAALTGLCIYAPTLGAPWLGTLADRLPRRPLVIGTDVLLAAIMLTLLAVSSVREVWLIYVVLLARGLSYVLNDAAETAILPSALPPGRLGDVNGWRASAQEGMKLIAPLAGAGLYAWSGPVPVVLLAAVAPLIAAGCYALLRLPPALPMEKPERGRSARACARCSATRPCAGRSWSRRSPSDCPASPAPASSRNWCTGCTCPPPASVSSPPRRAPAHS